MSVSIPQSVILMHVGSVATIPSGWSRVTALDGKFIKGTANGVNPNVSGGSSTHQHTGTSHSHTMDSHGHVANVHHISGDGNDSDGGGSELNSAHSHAPTVYGVVGGGLSSVASTYASLSNDPPYHEVVFIAPTGATGDVEANIASFWYAATVPTGWTFCDGSNGTPDLRNKFLKGAGTGNGAGATGGSTQNIHTLTHTHSESSHYHSEDIYEAGSVDDGGHRGSGSNGDKVPLNHWHRYRLNSNSAGGISSVTLTTSETVEPAYKKLMVIKNTSGGISQPQSLIGIYLGVLGSIPAGWSLCDGSNGTPDMRGQFLKVCNTSGELGNTGGSNTHSHASQNHTHTGSTHNHSSGSSQDDLRHNLQQAISGVGGGKSFMNYMHTHDIIDSIGSASVSWGNGATSADSQDNQPPFLTVAFVMFTGVPTNSERSAEITGKDSSNSEVSAEVTGVNPSEQRLCEITGQEADNSERGCEISGLLVWTVEPKPETPTWTVPEKLPT